MKEIQEMHGRGPSRAIRRGIGCGRRDPENPTRNTASAEPREPEAAASPSAHDFRILRQAPGGYRQPATGQNAQGKGHGINGPITEGLDRSPEPRYDAATEVVESSALPFAKLISQGDPGLTDRPR